MISRETARKIAISVCNKLEPFCRRINIAGSVRRGTLESHDVEIVCEPIKIKVGTMDLFGEDTRKEEVSQDFSKKVLSIGKVIKGKPIGRMMQIEVDNPFGSAKIMLDLFMPEPYDYYRQFAIRTGSADYSAKVIAGGWRKLGWVGTENGLRLEIQSVGHVDPNTKKTKWTCMVEKPELPPVWNSEEEFFNWLGVQYIPPSIRYVTV